MIASVEGMSISSASPVFWLRSVMLPFSANVDAPTLAMVPVISLRFIFLLLVEHGRSKLDAHFRVPL